MEFGSIIHYSYKNGLNMILRQILPEAKHAFLNSGHCVLLAPGKVVRLRSVNLKTNRSYGFLFENWMISEVKKNRSNAGQSEGLYYFRDNVGRSRFDYRKKMESPLPLK